MSEPRPAPTASAGANTPPGMRDTKASQITASLATMNRTGSVAEPSSAAFDSA